jgi:hypothetical protein
MKKKTTRRQVLLSFLGTTDPIRGERDGAMLHILRHYRPEVVCLLFTPEVRKLAEAEAEDKHGGRNRAYRAVARDV